MVNAPTTVDEDEDTPIDPVEESAIEIILASAPAKQ